MKHWYASNYVLHPRKGFLSLHVIETSDGCVVKTFPLNGEEMEHTEWLPGIIVLEEERAEGMDGIVLVPYWYYPFNILTLRHVSEIRRKRLK